MSHPIKFEQWEYEPMANIIACVALNTPDHGMTPNPHSSFRRYLYPDVYAAVAGETDLENRLKLVRAWECTLVCIEEAQLYNGTNASARAFEEATGLTSVKFAQAWLEAEGSIWHFFHPTIPGGGVQLAQAMCELWALKTQHWRTVALKVAAKEKLIYDTNKELMPWIEAFVEREMSKVMSLNGKNRATSTLLRALQAKVSFDCTAHPMAPFCSCDVALLNQPVIYDINTKASFVRAWKAGLMGDDNAFLYIGDDASAAAFARLGGKTPKARATEFVRGTPAPEIPQWFTASVSEANLVEAMLAYWANLMRGWRERCSTRQEARTKKFEQDRKNGEIKVVSIDTMVARPDDLHKKVGDDPLLRYIQDGEPGHKHTIVLYAKYEQATKDDEGGFGYDILRAAPCHPDCSFQVAVADIQRLTAPFVKEDMEKAKKVVAEWWGRGVYARTMGNEGWGPEGTLGGASYGDLEESSAFWMDDTFPSRSV